MSTQTTALGEHSAAVEARLAEWSESGAPLRLFAKDHTLWTTDLQPEILDRLGWLTLPETMRRAAAEISAFAAETREQGIRHIVLLGMGGSSLAPEVFHATFGTAPGHPELIVLDSTHPDAVRATEECIDLEKTLFLFSSKSGSTIEPLSFFRYFWACYEAAEIGPGGHFVAITDPGSPLASLAAAMGFLRVFETIPDVGGRYSALTHFGLVPAALIGADVDEMLAGGARMAAEARQDPAAGNQPFTLGAALGELARAGRDKATFLTSPSFAAMPAWIEQLVAESTGKDGTGVLPIADESVGPPGVYGDDRVFVYLTAASDADDEQAAAVADLEAAGFPVIRITADAGPAGLAGEMMRAEIAVAMAGSVLGIHPFDQPNVQLAKQLARDAMEGNLAAGDIAAVGAGDVPALRAAIGEFLADARPGDYLGLQAFIAPTLEAAERLQEGRMAVRDRLQIATTLGFGPRFLHSTGQLHKGGANTGLFIQVVDTPAADLAVPGEGFTFGDLIAGQADGDYQALADAGREVLRVHLGDDPGSGLANLAAAMKG